MSASPDCPSASGKDAGAFISYAQHGEDVLLWRALRDIKNGFYIDVGAYHPIHDSVTQAFYERGWHGINLEPVPANAATFTETRPRDLTLMVAVSHEEGSKPFYEVPGSGLSTFDGDSLKPWQEKGWPINEITVPTLTLAEICRRHVTRDIHFLKVDAELSERQVFEGADFVNFRPWIILVEAVLPMSVESTHQDWEHLILSAGYEFLFFDGLNRFYASAEKAEAMRPHLNRPANPVDGHRLHPMVELEKQVAALDSKRQETAARLKKAISATDLKTRLKAAEQQLKAAEQRLQYHSANPLRALKLWWHRLRRKP
jgi:FkbM family methyltransferase